MPSFFIRRLRVERFTSSRAAAPWGTKLYEGHYHDLLNDEGRDLLMADIVGWLETRLPAPAHGEAAQA